MKVTKSKSPRVVVGVDIGGSHVSCSAVNMETFQTIPTTYSSGKVNSKASKEVIFEHWSLVINETLRKIAHEDIVGIGIAMPGPFDYEEGVGLFQGNDKYEALFQVSVAEEFPRYLSRRDLKLRFMNDASSFGAGGALQEKDSSRIVAITLGTGFGAAFLLENIPVLTGKGVPSGGCLWDKPFRNGIADDFFSTRWFIKRYYEISGMEVLGVREIVEGNQDICRKIFQEFSENLSDFLLPYLIAYNPGLLILGGNIAKAQDFFLADMKKKWSENGVNIQVSIIDSTEEVSILGSSCLFLSEYWKKLQRSKGVGS